MKLPLYIQIRVDLRTGQDTNFQVSMSGLLATSEGWRSFQCESLFGQGTAAGDALSRHADALILRNAQMSPKHTLFPSILDLP